MRKFYFAVAPVLLIAALTIYRVSAANLVASQLRQERDEIQKYIEEWRGAYEPTIHEAQTQYLKDWGHYWQGVATHTEQTKPEYTEADKTQPIEEKAFVADCAECKPTDALSEPSWNDLFPDILTKLPASLRIDVYSGVAGVGYVINYEYCIKNTCYIRGVNTGPESWRDLDWVALDSEVVK